MNTRVVLPCYVHIQETYNFRQISRRGSEMHDLLEVKPLSVVCTQRTCIRGLVKLQQQ